jgi:hypothetical protein
MTTTSEVRSPSSVGNAEPTGVVAAQSEGGHVTGAFGTEVIGSGCP